MKYLFLLTLIFTLDTHAQSTANEAGLTDFSFITQTLVVPQVREVQIFSLEMGKVPYNITVSELLNFKNEEQYLRFHCQNLLENFAAGRAQNHRRDFEIKCDKMWIEGVLDTSRYTWDEQEMKIMVPRISVIGEDNLMPVKKYEIKLMASCAPRSLSERTLFELNFRCSDLLKSLSAQNISTYESLGCRKIRERFSAANLKSTQYILNKDHQCQIK